MPKLRTNTRRQHHDRLGAEALGYRARHPRPDVDRYALAYGLVHLALAGRHDEVRKALFNLTFLGASAKVVGNVEPLVLAWRCIEPKPTGAGYPEQVARYLERFPGRNALPGVRAAGEICERAGWPQPAFEVAKLSHEAHKERLADDRRQELVMTSAVHLMNAAGGVRDLATAKAARRDMNEALARMSSRLTEEQTHTLQAGTLLLSLLTEGGAVPKEHAQQLRAFLDLSRELKGEEAPSLEVLYAQSTIDDEDTLIETIEGFYEMAVATHGVEGKETIDTLSRVAGAYAEVGRHDEAITRHRQVVDATRRLLGDAHRTVTKRVSRLAIALHNAHRSDEAIALNRELVERTTAELGPDSYLTHEVQFALAAALDRGKHHAEALKLAETTYAKLLVSGGPEASATVKVRQVIDHARQELVKAHLADSKAAREEGRAADALAACEEAVALARLRVSEDPKPLRRHWLGKALSSLADVLRSEEALDEAEAAYEEAIGLFGALDEETPTKETYGLWQANLLSRLAVMRGKAGADTLDPWRRCLTVRERHLARFPDWDKGPGAIAVARKQLAPALGSQAKRLRDEEAYDDAKAAYEEAIALYGALAEEDDAKAAYSLWGGSLLAQLAVTLDKAGEDALEVWRRCLAVRVRHLARFPGWDKGPGAIAVARRQVGKRLSEAGDFEGACEALAAALATEQAASEAAPEDDAVAYRVVQTASLAARARLGLGELSPAMALTEACIEGLRALLSGFEPTKVRRQGLAKMLERLGDLRSLGGSPRDAPALWQEGREIVAALRAEFPDWEDGEAAEARLHSRLAGETTAEEMAEHQGLGG